jgi:serine/threonine protein kinase
MPEWIGKTIGKVRIDKLLARGGMAEVYLGTHLALERPVAIKVLHSFIEEEPWLLERFHREAKVVAGLRHPNIVQLYDFDTTDGHPYIVMEYLSGPTLATYLRYLHQRKKRLPVDQVAGLLKGLTDALDYAHRQGVIHRDIKPGNIMLHNKRNEIPLDKPLTEDVEAILTDFGLVRVVNTASQTASGFLSGTPAYMSPEQARGDQIDQRTDLYSLGIVLYEMLAGRVPFEADNTVTILHMHIHTPPPPIPGIPAKIQAVLDRALAKNPADRYQTSQEMANDFYRSIGMTEQAEVVRDPYPLTPMPIEIPPPTEPEPSGSLELQTVSGPKSQPRLEPELSAKPRSQTELESLPKSQPRTEPESAPKPSRSRIWIGVGLLSLIILSLLAVGGYRLFMGGASAPQATETAGPQIPNTGVSPLPSETSAVPEPTRMVKVDAGTYEVGRDPADKYHSASQSISLQEFWIDQYQTTNAEYEQYLAETGAPPPVVWPAEENYPVRGVSWDQAVAYCSWRNKRLPSEAEWEAAGRGSGPEPQLYPWGDDPTDGGNVLQLPNEDTYEVGSQFFNVSPFQIYDMVGNVWEWVGEPYGNIPPGSKILRGGRFGNAVDLAYRLTVAPDDTRYIQYAGFRCAADQVKE